MPRFLHTFQVFLLKASMYFISLLCILHALSTSLLDLIIWRIFAEMRNYEAPHYAITVSPTSVFSSALCSQTPVIFVLLLIWWIKFQAHAEQWGKIIIVFILNLTCLGRKIPGTHFCWRLSQPQVIGWLEGVGKLKFHLIRTWTSNLLACSIVPLPTMLLHAPTIIYIIV